MLTCIRISLFDFFLSLFFSPSSHPSVCLSVFLSLLHISPFLCSLFLSLSRSLFLSRSLSFSLYLSLSFSLTVYIWHPFCTSIFKSLSVCLSSPLTFSHPIFLLFSLSLSLNYIYIRVFLFFFLYIYMHICNLKLYLCSVGPEDFARDEKKQNKVKHFSSSSTKLELPWTTES